MNPWFHRSRIGGSGPISGVLAIDLGTEGLDLVHFWPILGVQAIYQTTASGPGYGYGPILGVLAIDLGDEGLDLAHFRPILGPL